MSLQTNITDKATGFGDYVGRFISTNGHAQQAFPAMHRASAAGGMYMGWKAFDKGRDIVFGNDQTAEGVFVDTKREDVPAPLRFLHHSIDWNPHSDAPSDQWKKVLYQTMPAMGAALGTVIGSMSIFHFNNRASAFTKAKDPKTLLSIMKADSAAQYSQAGVPLFITSLFGGGSAASMLIYPYGIGLNSNFFIRSGNAINLGNRSGGNLGPAKALAERIFKVPFYVKSAMNSGGKVSREWAEIFVHRAVKPIFGNSLNTEEKLDKAIKITHNKFQSIYNKHSRRLKGEALIKAVSKDMEKVFHDPDLTAKRGKVVYDGFDKFAQKDLGLNLEDAQLGNASWVARVVKEGWAKVSGIGQSTTAGKWQDRLIEQRDSGYTSGRRR